MSVTRAALAENILDNLSDNKLASVVAEYLFNSGRVHELSSLMRDISLMRRDSTGIMEVTAVSAHPLNEHQIKSAKSTVKKFFPEVKKCIINSRIDPDLIGGVRLDMVDANLDMSVKSNIEQLKSSINGKEDQQ